MLAQGACEMKVKWVILAVLMAFLVPAMISRSRAVNTDQIDNVRDKDSLTNEDLQIIDDFLAQAVQELVRTRDFTSVAKIRTVIVSKRSAQTQYAKQFSQSAHKHISQGLEQAKLLPEERQFKVTLNLLILADNLVDPALTDLAMAYLKDQNKAIRYWAVRCLTNPGLVELLNPGVPGALQLTRRILQQLGDLIDTSGTEILALITDFAARIGIQEGDDLLGRTVDVRVKRYADWTVEYELLDGAILKLLYAKLASAGPAAPAVTMSRSKAEIARRFGQLYSYVMQRYIKGADSLTDLQKHHLASVLAETEDKCIQRLLQTPQSVIRRAIERADYRALQAEYDRLFGSAAAAGALATNLNFDYGTDPAGNKLVAPLPLPNPPPRSAPKPPTN